MNQREAKRVAYDVTADAIEQVVREHSFDEQFMPYDVVRIKDGLAELFHEMERRGERHKKAQAEQREVELRKLEAWETWAREGA